MGLTLPTQGTTVVWGTALNVILQAIIDRLEAKNTPAGMTISADLSFDSNDATNVGAVRLYAQSATKLASGDEQTLYAYNGELYFTDNGLTTVQITSAGVLNAGAVGGIVGSGYGTNSVEVRWDSGGDAGGEYEFKLGSASTDFAACRALAYRISSGIYYLGHKVDALGATYNITWPAAAAAGLVYSDSSGNIDFVTTVTPALTLTNSPIVPAVRFSANQVKTISMATAALHQSREHTQLVTTYGEFDATGSIKFTAPSSTDYEYALIPINLLVGERIKGYSLYAWGSGTTGISSRIYRLTSGLLKEEIGTVKSTAFLSTAQTLTDTFAVPVTVALGTSYHVIVYVSAMGSGSCYAISLAVSYDRTT